MYNSFKNMSLTEKITKILAWITAGVIVFTIFSKEVTFAGIVSWFMEAAGWYLFACIAIPVLLVLIVAIFLRLLPYLMIACGLLGFILHASGGTVLGIILLVIAGSIMWFITGLDPEF